jgi:hypothetical protein
VGEPVVAHPSDAPDTDGMSQPVSRYARRFEQGVVGDSATGHKSSFDVGHDPKTANGVSHGGNPATDLGTNRQVEAPVAGKF